MKSLRTYLLLQVLSKYSFYSWEDGFENPNPHSLCFGLPQRILERLNVIDFYNTWGYDAVRNPNANPSFSPKQWIMYEHFFFSWLKKGYKSLFPSKEIVVTPEISNWWTPFESHPVKWTKDTFWQKELYIKYVSMLNETPCRPNFRGALIDDYQEFKLIGKMAVRNTPMLFFANEDRVVRFTEYLSVIVVFNSIDALELTKRELRNVGAQILW